MSGLKARFSRRAAIIVLLTLFLGWGTAAAVEDTFTAEINTGGEVIWGDGTGFNGGAWYYYANTDWWAQWFFNDKLNLDRKKVISVDLTVQVLNPALPVVSHVEAAVNWTSVEWPEDQDGPPLPDSVKDPVQERRFIERRTIVPQTTIGGSRFVNATFEIGEFCPRWVSIDIRGVNVRVSGKIRHECVSKGGPLPPLEDLDFGDAPEGVVAYPSLGVQGRFPTCVGVGPAAWIEHQSRWLWFGPKVDLEPDGNGGTCPVFTPNLYDQDEGFGVLDGDAGLIKPRAFTIRGAAGAESVWPLTSVLFDDLGYACQSCAWGRDIDIRVHNERPDERTGYVNLLIDWNRDGVWQRSVWCPDGEVPEHVLVDFPVPPGYDGPLSGLHPPDFQIGPLPDMSYVWARFTITLTPVGEEWNGDGLFHDGETEDYLLCVREDLDICEWNDGDPHKMHWAQLPDTRPSGLDVGTIWGMLADDFRCAQSGPITGIHFWGSFLDDHIPDDGVNSMTFTVNIYSNKPADHLVPWSRPGELLWSREIPRYSYLFYEQTSNISQGWFDPSGKSYEPANHKRIFQYDICLDDGDDLFVQRANTIYWIEIQEKRPENVDYLFGWRTTQQRLQFADNAVWRQPKYEWQPMVYPDGHTYEGQPLDLAFVLTSDVVARTDFGDAPDPTYPTDLLRDGARHTIVPGIHLGAKIDGEADADDNSTATGDDIIGIDDEDGVVFASRLVPGETASVEVTASLPGSLNAWIDWDADGDWTSADEHVFHDVTLSAGVNTLTMAVPAKAAAGQTFARFRFSTARGLETTGLAPDGEVEDYMVRIEPIIVPSKAPLERLKWSQPPIEHDPSAEAPVYCGWDELASAHKPLWFGRALWKLVADDFRCLGNIPVTSVHWWGSYEGWSGNAAPRVRPTSWRIGFWSNLAADNRYSFSRAGKLLWLVNVPADRVEQERAGTDAFPGKPSDTTFQYLLELEPQEFFQQGDFVNTDTKDRVFWISITAVYTESTEPENPWGWKTRPRPWREGAVRAQFERDDLRAGTVLDLTAVAEPVTGSLICERLDRYDMAFELDTAPEYVKWEQAFTGIRHWSHYEDEQSMAVEGPGTVTKWIQNPDTGTTGVDVHISKDLPPTWPATIGGDDFECTTTGPITGITLWGSWYHDILPGSNAENVQFTLSIREDIPASSSSTGYSMPGKVLWSQEFTRGQFTVEHEQSRAESYYSPANDTYERSNHSMVYKYTFKIDSSDAFRQSGTASRPVVYWLTAQAQLIHPAGSVATRFGWKTSTEHWNDDAVWAQGEEPYKGSWRELRYPREHPSSPRSIDLAFAIETEQAGGGTSFRRVVADDWRCTGTTPVSDIVWWGSYIGFGYRPCECSQMPAPRKPDAFLLSIWTDVPDITKGFCHPGEKIWEYEAQDFEEVLVGFDKHPEPTDSSMRGFEPVYRYSVELPATKWFRQDTGNKIYWLSVVAVYENERTIVYPWGWTNHPWSQWRLQGLDALAHWKLDETGGKTAADSSSNGSDGAVRGNPVWQPDAGWIGGALALDGRGDYIEVVNPTGFNFAPNSFSVSTWINPSQTQGAWRAILEYDRDGTNRNRFGLWLDADGRFHFRVGMNTWQTPQGLAPNQWYHLAATFEASTGAMKLYVNGQLEATATYQKGFNAPALATLTIGARGSGDGEFFTGLIDDVRVFGMALSADDVLALAGAGGNSGAVAAPFDKPWMTAAWPWAEIFDQTGDSQDMSFMLLTERTKLQAAEAQSEPEGKPDVTVDGGKKN